MFDLTNSFDRAQLANQISKDVEAATKYHLSQADEPRKHLGASVIGDPCERKSWLTFRWAKQEDFTGIKLRLFNRGHEEEARFIRWLEMAGFKVWDKDPETGEQFKISGSKGHFGGSTDGLVRFPTRYGFENLVWLGEFKTHNEKSFNNLLSKKLQLSKPQHFRQMCSYGKLRDIKYGLYCAVNKNDDELYFEIVELDFRLAEDLYIKADNVIFSQEPRPMVAKSKTYFDCKYCHFSGICYDNEVPQKNCRSCKNAHPSENGEWDCYLYAPNIPDDVIRVGCNSWTRII